MDSWDQLASGPPWPPEPELLYLYHRCSSLLAPLWWSAVHCGGNEISVSGAVQGAVPSRRPIIPSSPHSSAPQCTAPPHRTARSTPPHCTAPHGTRTQVPRTDFISDTCLVPHILHCSVAIPRYRQNSGFTCFTQFSSCTQTSARLLLELETTTLLCVVAGTRYSLPLPSLSIGDSWKHANL